MKDDKIDGWLLYDFRRSNSLACDVLKIPPETHLTRRFFYFIPTSGDPVKLVHAVESSVLDHLPGHKRIYLRWQELEAHLKEILKGCKNIAMEFSPNGAIPYVSKVDGGTIDLIRKMGVNVVSSATLLQYETSVLSEEQLNTHLEAADILDHLAADTWKMIRQKIGHVTELDVQKFIASLIEASGCTMEGMPICAVGANSANPHHVAGATKIIEGDFVLIDLWCKKKVPGAVYADISRVGVCGTPTDRQKLVFNLVRAAQKAATDLVQERVRAKKPVRGYEVDQAARQIIEKGGFEQYFTHRTGHNIYTDDHGPGANIDSLETFDDRLIIPNTCFSIEPGIYLPGEFGVRLEYDIYRSATDIQITGGIQENIKQL
jgi:Xaa-Pro aminopeptidase